MAEPLLVPPDLPSFLCGYVRDELPEYGVLGAWVDVVEPEDTTGWPLCVIVRDDGGRQRSDVSWEHQVGVSVLAGDKSSSWRAGDYARLVFAILTRCASTDQSNPVAAVPMDGRNGPYPVTEDTPVARFYMTLPMIVVGARREPV